MVYATAVLLIAARQHALLVLMHEGAHRTVSRNRALNDTLSDLLCGAPMLISTRNYRVAHLVHHQNLNSAADPDWVRKVDDPAQRDQWLFPANNPLWQLLGNTLYLHSITYLLGSLADYRKTSQSDVQAAGPTNEGASNESTNAENQAEAQQAQVPSDQTAKLGEIRFLCAGSRQPNADRKLDRLRFALGRANVSGIAAHHAHSQHR